MKGDKVTVIFKPHLFQGISGEVILFLNIPL